MSKAKKLIEILKRVLEIIPAKYRKKIPIVLFFSIIASLLELVSIALIVPFISVALDGDGMMQRKGIKSICALLGIENKYSLILALAIMLVLAFAIKNLALLFVRYYQSEYSISVQKELATGLFDSYLNRPYSFFLQNNTGVLAGRINNNVTSIYDTLNSYIIIITEGITVAGIVAFIFYTDPILALGVVFVAVLCVGSITIWLRKPISTAATRYYQALNDNNKALMQGLTAVKEVIVSGKREYFVESFDEEYEKKASMQKRFQFYNLLPERLVEMLFVGAIVLIVAYRMRWGSNMTSFVANLAGFAMGAYRLLPSMGKFTSCINTIIFINPSFNSGYDALKEVEEYVTETLVNVIEEDTKGIIFSKELSVSDLSFRYRDDLDYIIDGLNLNIKKGEAIGLVGESGAGKSTLVDVIMGLLKSERGGVYMDGIDIRSIPLSWSRNVGYVPQSVYLLDGSIRENIGFGLKADEIDDDKVWKVLEFANLKVFVEHLEDGLNTCVGERGVQLSGGQRQRIAIARALYQDPSILILDEATSALDNDTEEAVMESIENLIGNITMIIVAHRLTTIRGCDRIYRIGDGKAKLISKEDIGIV